MVRPSVGALYECMHQQEAAYLCTYLCVARGAGMSAQYGMSEQARFELESFPLIEHLRERDGSLKSSLCGL